MFTRRIVHQAVFRHFNSTVVLNVADKQLLSKLRKTTGFPFINCSKALEKFNNDIKQAEIWLREEAQKEGWSKATKLQSRPMSHGLIGISTSDNLTTMVEVNCETDFVARNIKFQNFVASVADALLHHGKQSNIKKALFDNSQLGELKLEDEPLSDLTAKQVGNLGENIQIRRGVLLRPDQGQLLSSYIHATGSKLQQSHDHCIMGKYGALVLYKSDPSIAAPSEEENTLTIEELGKQLCQHVVGMNPSSIGAFEDQPKENREDETRLLHQEFMLDTSCTVGDILKQYGLSVVDFIRLECGEEVPQVEKCEKIKEAQTDSCMM